MKSRFIITGEGGSGKDLLKSRLVKKGFIPSVSFTSRPPRDGERDGYDYFFKTEREFMKMVGNEDFFEHKEFNGWLYGTHKSDFENADVFIMTPPAIVELPKDIRDSSLVIYIDIDETIRSKRLSERKDADDVKRRIIADREMFECFTDYDLRVTSPTF
jgi:guanylate kinase